MWHGTNSRRSLKLRSRPTEMLVDASSAKEKLTSKFNFIWRTIRSHLDYGLILSSQHPDNSRYYGSKHGILALENSALAPAIMEQEQEQEQRQDTKSCPAQRCSIAPLYNSVFDSRLSQT